MAGGVGKTGHVCMARRSLDFINVRWARSILKTKMVLRTSSMVVEIVIAGEVGSPVLPGVIDQNVGKKGGNRKVLPCSLIQ